MGDLLKGHHIDFAGNRELEEWYILNVEAAHRLIRCF